MAVSLKMIVAYAACPICEHVPPCASGGDGGSSSQGENSGQSDDHKDVSCGVEVTSESPFVAARLDPRFMVHMPRPSPAAPPASCSLSDCAHGEQDRLKEQEQRQQQTSWGGGLDDASLLLQRSRVPSGTGSSLICTNLKHQYAHGYQVGACFNTIVHAAYCRRARMMPTFFILFRQRVTQPTTRPSRAHARAPSSGSAGSWTSSSKHASACAT
jgi:hypothetical protein